MMNAPQTHREPRDDNLTHVELTWVEKKIEHWIRFGKAAQEQILDRRRRIVSFAPGTVFAFVRWAANDHGTILSRIDIVRAISETRPSRRCHSCGPAATSCSKPRAGRKSSASCNSSTRSRRWRSIRPTVDPDHWRHIHNRIAAGAEPRAYTRDASSRRHLAPEGRVMTRTGILLTTSAVTVGVALTAFIDVPKKLIWNASASVPLGLYAITPADHLKIGDRVAVDPPEPIARYPRGARISAARRAAAQDCRGPSGSTRLQDRQYDHHRWHRHRRGASSAIAWAVICRSGRAAAASRRATFSS